MDLIKKIYRTYTYKVFPRIRHIRGSNRIWRILKLILASKVDSPKENATPIEDLEFDNLIILDACRYDIYSEIRGEVDHRITQGSATEDYVRENFSDGDWSDVVYITANPQLSEKRFKQHTGRSTEETFHTVYDLYNQGWSDKISTVPPDLVVKQSKSAAKLFPDKKKIIHFMQPHAPFTTSDKEMEYITDQFSMTEAKQAEKGDIPKEEYREMYKKELENVIEHALELAENLEGKTVITGDHGELLGEGGLYEHPPRMDLKPLKKVPLEIFEG